MGGEVVCVLTVHISPILIPAERQVNRWGALAGLSTIFFFFFFFFGECELLYRVQLLIFLQEPDGHLQVDLDLVWDLRLLLCE